MLQMRRGRRCLTSAAALGQQTCSRPSRSLRPGFVRSGTASVTIGTSGVVFAHLDAMQVDPLGRTHTFCHGVPGRWHIMGVMLSAGGSLRWLRDSLSDSAWRRDGVDPYDLMTAEAAAIPPGSEGLVFLPYLTGERTPHADPFARGAFIGLSLRHRRAHPLRGGPDGGGLGSLDAARALQTTLTTTD